MSLNLFNILKEVINESVDASNVNHAIDTKSRVSITYDDEGGENGEGRATGPRFIEPYVYGFTKAGNPCFRAYQYNGSSFRGTPKWKLFRLDRVTSWDELPQHFKVEPREHGWSAEKYNENGDESMSSVENQVTFDNDVYEPNSQIQTGRENIGRLTPDTDSELQAMIKRNMDITSQDVLKKEKEESRRQHRKTSDKPSLRLKRGETWNPNRVEPEEGETRKQAWRRAKREKEKQQKSYEQQYEKELEDIGFNSRPMFTDDDNEIQQDNKAEKLLHKN